ncbi:MAG: TRAP transporter small permease, partial [Chloroflexota bacterium]|nr:TRAP transporter small permease [Chloroflexota bacterium]
WETVCHPPQRWMADTNIISAQNMVRACVRLCFPLIVGGHIMKSKIERIFEAFIRTVDRVAMYLMLIVVFWATWGVVSRYFLHSAVDYLDITVVYAIMFIVLLPTGSVLREKKHISLDLIEVRLSGGWKHGVDIFNYLVTCVACGFLAYFTWSQTAFLIQIGASFETSVPIPRWPAALALFLGMAICTLASLERLVRLIFEIVTHRVKSEDGRQE